MLAQAAPAGARAGKRGPVQRDAGSSPGCRLITLSRRRDLTKGPLQQVRVADAAPLLGRGAQVRGGARQVLQETSHCGQIEALPALVERVGRSRAATLAASRGRLSAPSAIFQESHVTSSQ